MKNEKLWELILTDREKRYDLICEIIEKYKKPVLCGKLNYAGENKNNELSQKAFKVLLNLLKDNFKEYMLYEKILEGYDGKAVIMALNISPINAKKLSISIEDSHPLGRIFDIDIYDLNKVPLSRREFGRSRPCIICTDDARECIALKKHSFEEVIKKTDKIIINYFKGDNENA
ncbi:holo-ACP synthase [Caloramator quimbayensis]|uniref:citrate lyase holo-[acyl-carrier protein] synthase n=1 Tax=Caloramator quimbayensis TaxID=1147123 RepID=A0A1T4XLG3_9CLOT|nr:citrate lyase holo-[acyl-carrier protein] synthase [Caloramator quimbayensis]SKA90402.1 holo-ACP synthase [Caloramator quimbayensis]